MSLCMCFSFFHCTMTLHSMCRRYFLLVVRSLMSVFSLLLIVFIYRSFFSSLCVSILLFYHLRLLRSYSFDVVVYNFSVCCFMLLLSFVVVVVVVFLAFTFFRCSLLSFFLLRCDSQFALTRYWQKKNIMCAFFCLGYSTISTSVFFQHYYYENGRFVCARNRFNCKASANPFFVMVFIEIAFLCSVFVC